MLNYQPNENVPNLVIVPLGPGGTVCITSYAVVQFVVDVAGWFGTTATRRLTPLSPTRLVDTRIGLSGTRLRAQGTLRLNVRSLAALGASTNAVVLNVTAVNPSGAGILTVYPCDRPAVPETSNVNYATGQNVPNSVYVPMASDGSICIYSIATTDLLVDISGSFE